MQGETVKTLCAATVMLTEELQGKDNSKGNEGEGVAIIVNIYHFFKSKEPCISLQLPKFFPFLPRPFIHLSKHVTLLPNVAVNRYSVTSH